MVRKEVEMRKGDEEEEEGTRKERTDCNLESLQRGIKREEGASWEEVM